MSDYLRCLEKFRLRLSEKQISMTAKIHRVHYLSDNRIINVQSLIDIEKQKDQSDLYD